MKVLLINPPNQRPKTDSFPCLVFQPLGLAYLAAVLQEREHKVEILDCLGEGWDKERIEKNFRIIGLDDWEIAQKIKNFSPDVVGVGIPFTSQATCGHRIFKIVKSINQKIITIAGGADVTVCFKKRLADKNLDIAVIGEGEQTIVEFLQAINQKKNWQTIAGLAFKKCNKIIQTDPRQPCADLDKIPFPARNLLPMECYFKAAQKAKAGRIGSTLGKRWATIITSRGCPYNCIFCTIHQVMGRVWRPRSPEKVIEEIELLKQQYQIGHLLIEDDNLTMDIKRAEKLFDLMIKEKLHLTWSTPNGIRADRLNEILIKRMKQSGCTLICVAPESGDQQVMNNIINKNLDLKAVIRAVRWCKKYSLACEAFFIIGFPGETIPQMRKTLDFAKKLLKLSLQDFALFIATPFIGTRLYEMAKKGGFLRNIFDESKLRAEFQDIAVEPLIETPDFTASDLLRLRDEAIRISPMFSPPRIKFGLKLLQSDPILAIKVTLKRILRR